MTIALIGVVCAQVATQLVADMIMLSRDVEPRSMLGRAFVYRLAESQLDYDKLFMTRDEHAELIRRLKTSTADEVLRRTVDIVATTQENTWSTAFNRVTYEVDACANCCKGSSNTSRCLWAETDRRLNQVAWLALLSFDPVLMRDAALRTGEVLAPPFYPHQTWPSWGQPPSWEQLRLRVDPPSNERFDGPAMVKHFRWHLGTDFSIVVNLAQQLRGVMVLAAVGLLTILLPFARNAIPLCLGLLSAAIAYAAIISLVTVYVPRYGLPVDLLALFAILVGIISVLRPVFKLPPVKRSEDFKHAPSRQTRLNPAGVG
jgi:hypothetical protein